MKVQISRLLIILVSLLALLTYSFPYASYVRLAVCCGSLLYFMSCVLGTHLNSKNIYIISYILFMAWGLISYLWASSKVGVTEQCFNMVSAITVNLVMMMYIIYKNEDLGDICKWLLPIIIIYLLQSILVGDFNLSGRFSATGSVNQFGITTSYIFLVSLYVIKTKTYRKSWIYIILLMSAVLAILSGSRKALINIALFILMIYLFPKYNKNIFKNLGKVLLAVVVVVVFMIIVMKVDVLYNVIGYRMETLISYVNGNYEDDLSMLRRNNMMEDAIELFKENPIKGIGLNNFKYVARYGTYAHGDYYELLACLGLIGTALYYIPTLIALILSFLQWKRNEPDAVVPFAILLCFFINGFSNVSYVSRTIHLFVGLAAGIVIMRQLRGHLKS